MIKRMQLTPRGEDLGGMLAYRRQRTEEEGDRFHRRLKRAALLAMDGELTGRQKQVLTLYYFENRRMADIAAELGINKSTVSRTVKRAERHIRRCLQYWI